MGDVAKRQSIGVSFKDNSGEDGLVQTRESHLHTKVLSRVVVHSGEGL